MDRTPGAVGTCLASALEKISAAAAAGDVARKSLPDKSAAASEEVGAGAGCWRGQQAWQQKPSCSCSRSRGLLPLASQRAQPHSACQPLPATASLRMWSTSSTDHKALRCC
jgi:hypothetical protein